MTVLAWAFLLWTSPAYALDCAEILKMREIGVPDPFVVRTIDELSGLLTDADVACLQAGSASPDIVSAATRSAAAPRPPTTVGQPQAKVAPAVVPVSKPVPAPPTKAVEPQSPPSVVRPVPSKAAGPVGISCGELQSMLRAGVPFALAVEAVTEAGGLRDGTIESCSPGKKSSALPPQVASRSKDERPAAASPFACLESFDSLNEELSPTLSFARRALRSGDLGSSADACTASWAQLRATESEPAATPLEEDERVSASNKWRELCAEGPSSVYQQVDSCIVATFSAFGRLTATDVAPDSLREGVYKRAIPAAELSAGLQRAASSDAWDGPLRSPASAFAFVLSTPSPEAELSTDSASRAQTFRDAVFRRDWEVAVSTLQREIRFGEHATEARILAQQQAGNIAQTAKGMRDDPWGDMGVIRSVGWLPWIYAADSLSLVCDPFTVPQSKRKSDRLFALLNTVAQGHDSVECRKRALGYFEVQPSEPLLKAFEAAAGLDPPTQNGPRDRLRSTRQMLARMRAEELDQVTRDLSIAEAAVEQARANLPKKALRRFDEVRAQPQARCASETATVARLQADLGRFDKTVDAVEQMEARLGWFDSELASALVAEREHRSDSLDAARRAQGLSCPNLGRAALQQVRK